MKISKSWIPLQNNSRLNVTQSEGLPMPCAKFTMMGFTTNLVLTPNYSATCKVMNKLVIPKSKRQHINLLFTLQHSFNKLEASLLWAFISTTKPLLENFVALGNAIIYPRCLGAIFHQVFVIVKVQALDLQEIMLCLLPSYVLAIFLVVFPLYCHEALACFGPTFACFDIYSHYFN